MQCSQHCVSVVEVNYIQTYLIWLWIFPKLYCLQALNNPSDCFHWMRPHILLILNNLKILCNIIVNKHHLTLAFILLWQLYNQMINIYSKSVTHSTSQDSCYSCYHKRFPSSYRLAIATRQLPATLPITQHTTFISWAHPTFTRKCFNPYHQKLSKTRIFV